MSVLDLQIQMTQKDLDLLIKKYVAVSEQLRTTIQPDHRPPLEMLKDNLAEKTRQKEAELIELRSQLPGSTGKATPTMGTDLDGRTRYALLVGINEYQGYPGLDVCSSDAHAVGDSLRNRGYERDAGIQIVTDEDGDHPNRDLITNKMSDLAAKECDLLLFYFSGHGGTVGEESYLVMPQSSPANLKNSGIPLTALRQILIASKAKSKVIIIDCCHSGVSFVSKGDEVESLTLRHINHLYSDAKGWVVLASCEQTEFSYVWGDKKRSVFTHFLLEALAGEADFQKLGFVSAFNAYSYVQPRVKEWTVQKQTKTAQTPSISAETAGDIVLAIYK